MPLFSRLFGGGSKEPPATAAIEYQGFRIYPEPIPEDGGFRLAARIEMGAGEELKTHNLIRADVIGNAKEAEEAAVGKAKQMIDQMGAGLFH